VADTLRTPALERGFSDLPAFGQFGLEQIVVFSHDDSLVDAAKLQQLTIRQFWAADRHQPETELWTTFLTADIRPAWLSGVLALLY
jgi:hypothetical protein